MSVSLSWLIAGMDLMNNNVPVLFKPLAHIAHDLRLLLFAQRCPTGNGLRILPSLTDDSAYQFQIAPSLLNGQGLCM